MWPLYGFYVYCLHFAFKERQHIKILSNDYFKGLIIGIDAMILEVFANSFSLLSYNTFYFFYVPNDLWHFTTIQVFLPYVTCGIFGVKILKFLEKSRNAVFIGIFFYGAGLVLLFW
ncbi:MAG: hypothetical protein HQK76_09080 [Desulfobacterales bacterium]|nr:hypothetical protein [Desulfobacterales bacterium]